MLKDLFSMSKTSGEWVWKGVLIGSIIGAAVTVMIILNR